MSNNNYYSDGNPEADTENSSIHRRTLLKSSGATLAGLAVIPTVGAAKSSKKNLQKFKKKLSKEYNTKEAKIITKYTRKWLKRQRKEGLSDKIAYRNLKESIMKNPHTKLIERDIEKLNAEVDQYEDTISEGTVALPTQMEGGSQ